MATRKKKSRKKETKPKVSLVLHVNEDKAGTLTFPDLPPWTDEQKKKIIGGLERFMQKQIEAVLDYRRRERELCTCYCKKRTGELSHYHASDCAARDFEG